ncbi:MAG: DUF58 domain-containing protein [Gemmatimonadaceae bacterium]
MTAAAQPVVPQFLDPTVLAKIGNLELIARVVVEGFLNGLHRSPHLGMSMDFAEHRAYMPGDDIRRIDWKLFGRTDRHYLKEFEADTNANFSVLLDISRSMGYGSRGLTKLDYARYLAACLLYFSHKQRDRIGFATFDDDIVDFVPPSAKHLPVALHTIERLGTRHSALGAAGESGAATRSAARQPSAESPVPSPDGAKPRVFERALAKFADSVRRRSILVLISDLYDEPRSILDAISHLRGKGNDIIVMHLLDPAELDFPFDEAASFEDLESAERLSVIPEYLRDEYRAMVAEHVATLGKLLGENRIDYTLFNTSEPLDRALFSYLSNRQRLSRVR